MADKILTTKATAKGGREGHVKSDNGVIDLDLSMPKGDDIPSGVTNPEQLFAAGYAACFDGALNLMASKEKKEIDSSITSEVSLIKHHQRVARGIPGSASSDPGGRSASRPC